MPAASAHATRSRPLAADVAAVRAFNRFYTHRIGVLKDGLAGSAFTLTEARVLYEIATRNDATAGAIGAALGLDAGYLSRILRRFETGRLVTRVPDTRDRRARRLALTSRGRRAFGDVDRASRAATAALLRPLAAAQRGAVVDAMRTIEGALDPAATTSGVVLRAPQPGDWGWIVERHGALYAAEYGWGPRFEGLVAGIVAEIVAAFDPASDRCWIAERDGVRVGSVCVVRASARVAKLRLFLLEPAARGIGLGAAMVDACTQFARDAGYHRIKLWTQRNLGAARHLYAKAGYRCTGSEAHAEFGVPLVSETWELVL
ncbi:MAG: GNAT family N-acetyltransferase [Proteobacteria bacterium]|nr:GNAT family N-acetyltransferase [Pseudomonadota bacterium]